MSFFRFLFSLLKLITIHGIMNGLSCIYSQGSTSAPSAPSRVKSAEKKQVLPVFGSFTVMGCAVVVIFVGTTNNGSSDAEKKKTPSFNAEQYAVVPPYLQVGSH